MVVPSQLHIPALNEWRNESWCPINVDRFDSRKEQDPFTGLEVRVKLPAFGRLEKAKQRLVLQEVEHRSSKWTFEYRKKSGTRVPKLKVKRSSHKAGQKTPRWGIFLIADGAAELVD